MMPGKRNKYTAQFKLTVITFAENSNNSAAGREYGVNEKLIHALDGAEDDYLWHEPNFVQETSDDSDSDNNFYDDATNTAVLRNGLNCLGIAIAMIRLVLKDLNNLFVGLLLSQHYRILCTTIL